MKLNAQIAAKYGLWEAVARANADARTYQAVFYVRADADGYFQVWDTPLQDGINLDGVEIGVNGDGKTLSVRCLLTDTYTEMRKG